MKQLAATREDLRAKQRAYDARLLQIPEVEREYRELTRDYENAQTRYREIRAKQMQAEGAVELEKDLKAERFSLGEPANLPHKPYSPDRPRIALLGLLASLGGGPRARLAARAVRSLGQGPAGARAHRHRPDPDADSLHRDAIGSGRASDGVPLRSWAWSRCCSALSCSASTSS